jgi:uncharacterized surface protein with fasciclin (FAS1) repeats
MRTLTALLVGVGLLGIVACSDAASPSSPTNSIASTRSTLPTIAGVAVANSDFSTLVAALQKAGLVSVFDTVGSYYTVFAPTNAAFDAAAAALIGPGNTGMDLVNALDVPTLTSVLTYHVTLNDRTAQMVLSAGSLTMLDGNTARITTAGGARIQNANIVATDIQARNGYIHVIDAVILPPALQ